MSIALNNKRVFAAKRRLRGINVQYSRGAGTVADGLRVVRGSTRMSLSLENGAEISSRHRDYLILAEELVIDSVAIEPRPGDVITEEDGSQFEIVPLFGEPAWRWNDQERVVLRVHAQQIES